MLNRTSCFFRPLTVKIAFPRRIVVETPLIRLGTAKFRRFIVDLIPWKTLHQLRDIADVIHNTSVEIINSKKRALKEGDEAVSRQIGEGKDILSILSRRFSFLDYAWTSPLIIIASKYGCLEGG